MSAPQGQAPIFHLVNIPLTVIDTDHPMLDPTYSSPPTSQLNAADATAGPAPASAQTATIHADLETNPALNHSNNAVPAAPWMSKRALEDAETAKERLLDPDWTLKEAIGDWGDADERALFK